MLFKILHGDKSRISTDITPYHEGYCYVTHDGDFYVDMNNERVKLNAKDAETLSGVSWETIKDYIDAVKDYIILKDQVNGYNYMVSMRNGNLVSCLMASGIEVMSYPKTTTYTEGEVFDPTGMVVYLVYPDGDTKEVTDFIYPTNALSIDDTSVVISYVEGNLIFTTTVPITVNTFDAATTLADFSYTTNADGTYTITGWKGTLNGTSSTEMSIPNSGLIIV